MSGDGWLEVGLHDEDMEDRQDVKDVGSGRIELDEKPRRLGFPSVLRGKRQNDICSRLRK